MSTFGHREIACPGCARIERRQIAEGVNLARHAAAKASLLAGDFHRFSCGGCEITFEVETRFSWVDLPGRQLFVQHPARDQARWRELEAEVVEIHRRNLAHPDLPSLVRTMGEGMRVRVVFGLEALREKVVCFDAGLDDGAVEVLKVELLRRSGGATGLRLRLTSADADRLTLSDPTGRAFSVSRGEYDAAATPRYAAARASFAAGPFVDVARMGAGG